MEVLRAEQSALLRAAVLDSSLSSDDRRRVEGAVQWLEAAITGRVEANWRTEAEGPPKSPEGANGSPWMRSETERHPDEPESPEVDN